MTGSQLISAQSNLSFRRACYQSGAADYDHVAHLVTDGYTDTYWASKTGNTEWIYVDLGVTCAVSAVNINWHGPYAKEYSIQAAQNGPPELPEGWKDVYHTTAGKGATERIKLSRTVKARYIKVLCIKSADNKGYAINELEIIGNGGVKYVAKTEPSLTADGKKYLTGGNWKLQRASLVKEKGGELSTARYNDAAWVPATVPGTVLTSYLNIGALPDPNYGDQQLMISEAFFNADFWYRDEFEIPASYNGKRVWLNFDGINWKADIYLNGKLLGDIKGAFIGGRFDVTSYIKPGSTNALAVLIHKNDNPGLVTEQHLNDPGKNGGIIGFDSPTFLASMGWNWMPTIRGRNNGIWNDVFFNATSAVTIDEPFVTSDLPLPDTTSAALTVQANLTNHSNTPATGVLKGRIGDIEFSQEVKLSANESKIIVLNPASHPQLKINHPRLWWPNGYGSQPLYQIDLSFIINGQPSDEKQLNFGIRKYTYTYDNNNLRVWVNGCPVMIRGGNWGMAESMLRCDKEGYDLRVKLHKEMNLNMIRNWIGMVGDEEFYDACDKYGIMIWDDFWLANPLDGPTPKNEDMFMANVRAKIIQRRNHAALALWCGRNEGYPPATLDSAMRIETGSLDGTRLYISNSANKPVTGLGPYENKDPIWYFQNRGTTLHSEQGLVAVPPLESMKAMMPASALWPIGDMWGKHDWTQPRVSIYKDDLTRSYGEATGIADFCRKAQMMNMEGPKALMETWRSNRGPGVIVWMTHPAWPSLICQTYDYFFEPNAAYFAFKKASEPLHILWRADNGSVEVANDTRFNAVGLTAEAKVFDATGKVVFSKILQGDVSAGSARSLITLPAANANSAVEFISLNLKDAGGHVLSTNFYWRGSKYQDYTSLNSLPQVGLTSQAVKNTGEGYTSLKVTIANNTGNVALMARLKVAQQQSGKRVLPAFYSDNYISLVPGETRQVTITFENKFLENDIPQLLIEGWNVKSGQIQIQ